MRVYLITFPNIFDFSSFMECKGELLRQTLQHNDKFIQTSFKSCRIEISKGRVYFNELTQHFPGVEVLYKHNHKPFRHII